MINFFYKFGKISILSFFISNLLFFFFEKLFAPSIASFITIIIVFFINTKLFFKTELFSKNKSNFYRLFKLSISFRVFEFLLFNTLNLFILPNFKSNYVFLITLIISFTIKTIVYYKLSDSKKLNLDKRID